MILFTNLIFVITAILTRAYRQWQKYYDVMLFVSFCNLLYNFICKEHLNWAYNPDLLLTHKTADILNTFVLLPTTTLLYLCHFPTDKLKKVIYYLIWVTGFSAIEYIWFFFGRITYHHGWNFVWSIGFYFLMFLTIRLLHTKRAIGLFISLISVVFLVIYFKVPLQE